ncbi:MAG: hypothetical protein ABIH35_01250 [Patescibacteria group bacterium]
MKNLVASAKSLLEFLNEITFLQLVLILFSLLSLIIFLLVLIRNVVSVWKNTYLILNNNRSALGRGLGKHFADRFIRIWYSDDLMYGDNSFENYLENVGLGRFRHNTKVIDDELAKMKLIKIDKHENKVYPIHNWKNRLTLKIAIYWLVIFSGDRLSYYKGLKKHDGS